MKKILLTICAILICANTIVAQVTISRSELVGTKWQLSVDYESHSSEYYEFTKKEFIWHRDDGTTGPSSFYLSNTIPAEFNSTKVGVSTKGCYLNKYISKDHFTCYAIITFDSSKGIMVLELKNEIFIGPNDPVTFIRIDNK